MQKAVVSRLKHEDETCACSCRAAWILARGRTRNQDSSAKPPCARLRPRASATHLAANRSQHSLQAWIVRHAGNAAALGNRTASHHLQITGEVNRRRGADSAAHTVAVNRRVVRLEQRNAFQAHAAAHEYLYLLIACLVETRPQLLDQFRCHSPP